MGPRFNPVYLIVIGGALVLLGWLLPFLWALGYINTASIGLWGWIFVGVAQIMGLVLGIIGSASYVSNKRRKNRIK